MMLKNFDAFSLAAFWAGLVFRCGKLAAEHAGPPVAMQHCKLGSTRARKLADGVRAVSATNRSNAGILQVCCKLLYKFVGLQEFKEKTIRRL